MKYYTLDSEFNFGKYAGKTLKEVAEIEPNYINWCILNLDHFFIPNELIQELSKESDFHITSQAQLELNKKRYLSRQRAKHYSSGEDHAPRYEKYGHAYGYDDDTIDSAFEGDPENYWNID